MPGVILFGSVQIESKEHLGVQKVPRVSPGKISYQNMSTSAESTAWYSMSPA
jgi:hypothetical protein